MSPHFLKLDNQHSASIDFNVNILILNELGVIEVYDLESGEWSTVERYPQDIWEHLCATLYIPKCRDDMDVIPEMPRS